MNRKSILSLLAVVSVVSLMILAACSGGKTPPTEPPSPITWTPDMACYCHAKYEISMTDSALLVYMHVQEGEDECTDCHELTTLEIVHATVLPAQTADTERPLPQAFCLNCHETYADIAKLTVNSTVLTDANGTVVNPHDVPLTPGHVTANVTECSNCHKMHKTYDAINYCYRCHHDFVFECGTCHQ